MNALPIAGGLALVVLIACSTTNKSPDQPQPASAVVPVMAAAPAQPQPAAAPAGSEEARVKVNVLAEPGSFTYTASGGRSPFEKVECKVAWGKDGAGSKATALIVARAGRFKSVKRERAVEADAMRTSMDGFLTFDPMTLDEEQVGVTATDLHTYTLEIAMGSKSRTVVGYGLQEGSNFEALIRGMDTLCDMDSAYDEARGG